MRFWNQKLRQQFRTGCLTMLVTLIVLFVLLGLVAKLLDQKPSKLPPGKWGLPGIGYMPVGSVPFSGNSLEKMKAKHGDIFSWRIGTRIFVILCNSQIIKEAFKKMELSGRPDFVSYECCRDFKSYGINTNSGDNWQTARKFVFKALRDAVFGKSSIENIIQFEAAAFVDNLGKHLGERQKLSYSLNVALHNVIWKLLADKRHDNIDDKDLHYFEELTQGIFEDAQSSSMMLFDSLPWLLKTLPMFLQRNIGVYKMNKNANLIKDYLKKSIEEHVATLDESDPRDLIDLFLHEILKERKEKNCFCYDGLVQVMFDLFVAGSETTSSTVRWAVNFLTKHREVQEKLQKEIDEVIGRSRQPSMDDRKRMPYTEAIIHETLRLSSFLPLTLPHCAVEDTEIGDYILPKGAVVMGFAEGCHKDATHWERPNVFYPQHFLDKDGNFMLPKHNFLPFSTGQRMCIGDAMAKMELFIFLTTLFQNLSFFPACEEDFDLRKEDRIIYFNVPKILDFIISKRV